MPYKRAVAIVLLTGVALSGCGDIAGKETAVSDTAPARTPRLPQAPDRHPCLAGTRYDMADDQPLPVEAAADEHRLSLQLRHTAARPYTTADAISRDIRTRHGCPTASPTLPSAVRDYLERR